MTALFVMARHVSHTLSFLALLGAPFEVAKAGAPYITDDPGIPDRGQFDLYLFTTGAIGEPGGTFGLELNYALTDNVQLTANVPMERDVGGPITQTVLGNPELAAKYRFIRQDDFGWDVATAPRLFLPSSANGGSKIFIPIWIGKSLDKWSTFGGGGCTIDAKSGGKNHCIAGWAVTYQIAQSLSLGTEIYRQGAEATGAHSSTGLGLGFQYTAGRSVQLLTALGPRFEDVTGETQLGWHMSVLLSF